MLNAHPKIIRVVSRVPRVVVIFSTFFTADGWVIFLSTQSNSVSFDVSVQEVEPRSVSCRVLW